jgi:hypothetical protein
MYQCRCISTHQCITASDVLIFFSSNKIDFTRSTGVLASVNWPQSKYPCLNWQLIFFFFRSLFDKEQVIQSTSIENKHVWYNRVGRCWTWDKNKLEISVLPSQKVWNTVFFLGQFTAPHELGTLVYTSWAILNDRIKFSAFLDTA